MFKFKFPVLIVVCCILMKYLLQVERIETSPAVVFILNRKEQNVCRNLRIIYGKKANKSTVKYDLRKRKRKKMKRK